MNGGQRSNRLVCWKCITIICGLRSLDRKENGGLFDENVTWEPLCFSQRNKGSKASSRKEEGFASLSRL